MIYLILLIMEYILVETSGLSLFCTNDLDKLMSCDIDANNCTGLTLTIFGGEQKETCAFDSCVRGCCCSTEIVLYYGDKLQAQVSEDGQTLHTQTVKVDETIKPKAPHIDAVSPSNGIYQIQWRTNMRESIRDELRANVTYHKEGDDTKISVTVNPPTYKTEDKYFSDIYGQTLEPSTTYVVSMKTYTAFGLVSDNSNTVVFTTAASSTDGGLIALILCLSVFAVVGSSVAFASFFKLKGKLWDKAAKNEKPDILHFKPNKKVIFTPEPLSVDSLSVEPLVSKHNLTLSKESLSVSSSRSGQTSGISTASSSSDYANAEPVNMVESVLEALKKALPISFAAADTFSSEGPVQTGVFLPTAEKTSSPTVFENKTYLSSEIVPNEDMDLQNSCDLGYHSQNGPMLHDLITPAHASAAMETDMSYHRPCTQPEEASSDSQDLLTVGQDYERLEEQSSNTSGAEEMGESHCVMIPRTCNDMVVDYGYHCV